MRNYFHLMTMAILTVAFAACEKESGFLADVTYPEEADGNAIVVDAWANNFPLEIKTEGEWRIESDDFIYVVPDNGEGHSTVTVYLEINQKEQRKKGEINIIFPGHESQNRMLKVEQKWMGEYDENADEMGTTNNIYGFGFGYDTTKGLYANSSCLKAEIFQTGRLINEKKAGRSTLQMHTVVNTVTGNSITDLSNKLTVKMGANGGVGKFKAEAKASFTMNYKDNSNHEYAINYLEAALYTTSCDLTIETLRTSTDENKYGYMTAEAYKAINGLDPNFSSTLPNWAKDLVKAYGTHVVMSSRLGGRVRQSLDIDITNIEESYDLNVFAKASYEGVLVKEASGSVEDDFHATYKKHKDEFKTELDVLGGDLELATKMTPKGGFNESNYTAWLGSLKKNENLALVGFAEGGLVPLYEVVDKVHYPSRYEALYDYIHNGKAAVDYPDNSTYDSGTVTAFDVPDFSDNQAWGKTLVKEIRLGGQLVGQICEEYIPAINDKQRVIVVYPVIGTTVRYNMGFFIGDETHQPARVAWNGTTTNIEAYDLDFGQVSTLYLRGASITTTPAEGAVVKWGTLDDKFLTGLYYDIGELNYVSGNVGVVNKRFDYPLVKIFNKLWTRIDYCQAIAGNDFAGGTIKMDAFKDYEGRQITDIKEDDWLRRTRVYYSPAQVKDDKAFPAGWRVASSKDYEEMWGKLKSNQWSLPGLALMCGQVTGYDIIWAEYKYLNWQSNKSRMEYITSDCCRAIIQDTGQFEVSHDTMDERWRMCLRLIKE